MLKLKITDVTAYERIVHTPDEAAVLVASGCGCSDEGQLSSRGSFAVLDAEAEVGEVTWTGVIGVENELTGDGRLIELNALRWEDLPIPLRYAPVDNGGHQGAQVVGRILTIERQSNGELRATGDFDMSAPLGPEAARVVDAETENGVSMDLDDVSFEIRIAKELLQDINDDLAEDPPQLEAEKPGEDEEGRVTVMEINSGDEVMVTTDARVRAATIVSIPAFSTASITLDSPLGDRSDEAPAELVAGAFPLDPPAEWFSDPNLDGPTALTITEEGHVYGHLAVWGTCHTAYSGQCVEPPHSPSGYAYFRTGSVLTREGSEIPTGVITLDTTHAGKDLGPADTLAHYEHTGKGVADVAVGEDVFGIWVSGAMRPGVPDRKAKVLRASPLSGDWRRIGGALELVAALSVNVQGFPVPRAQGLVASGVMSSLVASGMVAPDDTEALGLSEDDLRYLRKLAARERRAEQEAQAGIQSQADALAAKVRSTQAEALARRVGVR